MSVADNPYTRFGFEYIFLFDGTWHVKGDPGTYVQLVIAYINTLGCTLQRQGISSRRLRVAPFPDFSYRVVPTRDGIFLLLGESSSRTARYAIYEDGLEGPGPGREALLTECEEVLGWDHCLIIQFPGSALTNVDHLNQAAESAAQETAAHLIGIMHDQQEHEYTAKTSQAAQTLLLLIADDDLRQRCEDILSAEKHYDRVIREACVILEHRVRQAIGADSHLIGTALMEQAFNPKNGVLRLSTHEPEQRGAMQLYLGIMAFFRNPAGHQIANDTYTQNDALRFVLWVDVLLKMIATASIKEALMLPSAHGDALTSSQDGDALTLTPQSQADLVPPAKKPPVTRKKKASAPTAKATPASKPKAQATSKPKPASKLKAQAAPKKAKATKAATAPVASPPPAHAIRGADRQQMISFLVQTYKEARKSHPNGWVPITDFGSRLMLAYPSFKQQFHPKMRLPTFLKQQQDIFQTQTKGKHLELRLLESYQ